MALCVLRCGREAHGQFDICETCRGGICAKTRDKSAAQIESESLKQDVKYQTYLARNEIARSTKPGSYMEQLTAKRKMRKQLEQTRAKQRTSRRSTRAA